MTTTKKPRQSNFELLRILCMLGVMTNHVLQTCYPTLHKADFSFANDIRVWLMCMSIVAVNCFVMISGYFRIRPSWKGFFNLWSQCAFYMLLITSVSFIFFDGSLLDIGKKMIFCLSGSGYWFLVAYFALYLFAPILNAAFEQFSKQQRTTTLASLLLMDVYIGYMHQCPEVSIDGYSAIHFFVIYYLGMYLSGLKSVKPIYTRGGVISSSLVY